MLLEETGVPGENHWPVSSQWQIWSDDVVSNTISQWVGFELITLVVLGTDAHVVVNPTTTRS